MDEIQKINDRLKAACVKVRVIPKGKNLGLRATLPKKPQDGIGRKQYDISLRIPASKDGFKRAEREAHKLAQSLADGSFSWEAYLTPDHDPESKTISQWVEEFKDEYFRTHRIQEKTWDNTWVSTLRKLPQDKPLKESDLLAIVLSTEPDTRNRELTCQRLQKLGEFAGLKIDLSVYAGDYAPKPREIPDDATIVEWRDRIPAPKWQWAYGVMAAFGIRPHEIYACQMVDPLTLRVHDSTKTGSRLARAIHPEWSEKWNLIEMNPPQTTRKGNRERGQLVSRQFGIQRYNLPFVPYDLRHAYAVRASVVKGLPVSTAAALMGHSPDVHLRTYHRWLSDAENERVYRSLILGEG
jgi:integrase